MSPTPFAHINAEKSGLYRGVMQVFVTAKESFLVHLRPEDVHERLSGTVREEIERALQQLVEWGNLQAEPDTGRVTTVEDFYRARYLYQLTKEGEAAEIALVAYDEALGRRGALQAVALADIRHQLRALRELLAEEAPDSARVHFLLRDLSRVFAGLAENAQAFMAGLGRALELRGADREAFLAYKERLIDYLQRFIGELVTATADIARLIRDLGGADGTSGIERLLRLAAVREAQDALEGAGEPLRLSAVGLLDRAAFSLFPRLLGDALGVGGDPDTAVTTLSGDGTLRISLTPLGPETRAWIETPDGDFGGRDYLLRIADLEEP
jgi:uncharacterized protein (TIGR02677 family)